MSFLGNRDEDIRNRIAGGLVGLAVCDALGMPNEVIRKPREPKVLKTMEAGGELELPKGAYTDDTSHALALAESMIESNGFDPTDHIRRYIRVVDENYLGSTDKNIGTGRTIKNALESFKRTGLPYVGPSEDNSGAGNGCIMRLFPVPAFYAYQHHSLAIRYSGDSAMVTHPMLEAADASRYLGWIIHSAINGAPKDFLLSDPAKWNDPYGYWKSFPLHRKIAEISKGSFRSCNPKTSGSVWDTLESALWAFARTDTFETGAVEAVSLGGDSDSRGAVFGQMAGAHYGIDSIPREWRDSLLRKDLVEGIAQKLYVAAKANKQQIEPLRSF